MAETTEMDVETDDIASEDQPTPAELRARDELGRFVGENFNERPDVDADSDDPASGPAKSDADTLTDTTAHDPARTPEAFRPPEDETPPPAEPAKGADALNERQAKAAKELGISEAELGNLLSDPGALLELAALQVHRKVSDMGRRLTGVQPKAVELEIKSPERLERLSEDDLFTPEGVERINVALDRINEFGDEVALNRRERQQRVEEQEGREIDSHFAGQVDADGKALYPDVWGIAPAGKLAQDGPQMQHRVPVIEKARELQGVYEKAGLPRPFSECLEDAQAIVGKAIIERAAEEKGVRKGSKFRSATVPRPGGRRPSQDVDTDEAHADRVFAEYARRTGRQIPA